jgi:hypothetical protein
MTVPSMSGTSTDSRDSYRQPDDRSGQEVVAKIHLVAQNVAQDSASSSQKLSNVICTPDLGFLFVEAPLAGRLLVDAINAERLPY